MGLAVWVAPVGAASLSMRTDRLIERLEGLGVAIDRLERCGPGLDRGLQAMRHEPSMLA